MFNVVIVCHRGRSVVPRFFTLGVSGMSIHVHVTADNAFFSLQPAAYSVSIRGVPVFSTEQPDIPADAEPVSREAYEARLADFLVLRISAERARADTQMDLLRFYFMENNMEAAKALLRTMENTAETAMLRFIAEDPRDFSKIESRYFVSSAAFAGGAEKTRRLESDPPCRIGSKKELDAIVSMCSEFDESTATIFLLEILDTVAAEMLPRLVESVKITSLYKRIYLRLKAAEMMLRLGMERTAVFLLISTSMEVASARDLLLKNELVRIAMERVTDARWAAEIGTVLARIRAEEIRRYGAALTGNVRCRVAGKVPELTVTGHTRLFSFRLFKLQMEGCCTGGLRIFNRGRVMVDGLLVNSGSFVPVFSDCAELVVDCTNVFEDPGEHPEPRNGSEDKVCVDAVLLSSGEEVRIDREFRLVERECDVSLVGVECADKQLVYVFEISGNLNTFSIQKKYGSFCQEGKTIRLSLREGTRVFTVDVEVARGVFEEKTFYVGENGE